MGFENENLLGVTLKRKDSFGLECTIESLDYAGDDATLPLVETHPGCRGQIHRARISPQVILSAR
jgi:hypothetical protein